ncbi:MAG: tRNA pseudouridine(55) synthase TruB, partial [Metamycoplasmataceae bacterium]
MFKLIYKEKGISSFKAISQFAKENNIKKIGHTGTLDPIARGLLLVATDDDTKLIEYITNKNKTYIAEATFNIETDSYDSEGKIIKIYDKEITLEMIKSVIPSFIGEIEQIPPIFSAKKINGKKAYEFARNDQKVILQPIKVNVNELNIISFSNYKLTFEISVSNGTYIRSIIHDLGKSLNTGAIMSELERTKIHGLSKGEVDIDFKKLINLPFIEIEQETLINLLQGKKVSIKKPDNKYGILSFDKNDIIGIIKIKNNEVLERKLFG